MNKFKNWFDEHERINCNSGDKVIDVYAPITDDKGYIKLEVVGKHDLYSEIQSHAESVNIHCIIQRYKNGEIMALNRRNGMFIDVSDMPSNYAEFLNTVIEGQSFFDNLKPEIKEKFNNNFTEFMGSIGSEKFYEAFGLLNKDAADDVKEVIESE